LISKPRQVLLWLIIISGSLVFVWYLQTLKGQSPKELSFAAALTQIRNKDIKEVTVKQDTLELTNRNDAKFIAKLDAGDSFRAQIFAAAKETDTLVKLEPPSTGLGWPVVVNALPFILLTGFLVLFMIVMVAFVIVREMSRRPNPAELTITCNFDSKNNRETDICT
jgi:ATP-dependent Zn protease